jgi:hypothetical protein
VNIAAAMAALKADDLDSTAKFAVLALACHADREHSVAKVRVAHLAAEMGIDRRTAWSALKRAEKGGYVTVEKVGLKGDPWRVFVSPQRPNTELLVSQARRIAENSSLPRDGSSLPRDALKKIFKRRDLEGAAAPLASTASDDASVPAPVDKRGPAGMPPSVAGAARAALNGSAK